MKPEVASIPTRLLIALTLASAGGGASASDTCVSSTAPCKLGDRSYHLRVPETWDGKTPLPVLLHFHGWGRQGDVPVRHRHVGAAASEAGALLVAPDGLGKSWAFWQPGSRDTDFALAVLADVEKMLPIDRSRLFVSGYSWGSSMAWRFSCEAGQHVTALLGISGTFNDQSETCQTGPVEVRHVHGLKDTVMDFPYGPGGDETGPVRLWLRENGCDRDPDDVAKWETSMRYTHYVWDDCASGKSVRLDVHGGGHRIAPGWLARQLRDLLDSNDPAS